MIKAWWRKVLCNRLNRHEPPNDCGSYCRHCYRMIEHNVGARRWFAVSGPQR